MDRAQHSQRQQGATQRAHRRMKPLMDDGLAQLADAL